MPKVAMTLRMDPELHRRAKAVARRRGATLTGLVQSVVEEAVREEEQRELFEAFSLVSEEVEETAVEFAVPAENEVVSR